MPCRNVHTAAARMLTLNLAGTLDRSGALGAMNRALGRFRALNSRVNSPCDGLATPSIQSPSAATSTPTLRESSSGKRPLSATARRTTSPFTGTKDFATRSLLMITITAA